MKKRSYAGLYASAYFWWTYEGQEIDLVEEGDGKLRAYEFKWSPDRLPSTPSQWLDQYPEASFEVVHPGNYTTFIL